LALLEKLHVYQVALRRYPDGIELFVNSATGSPRVVNGQEISAAGRIECELRFWRPVVRHPILAR